MLKKLRSALAGHSRPAEALTDDRPAMSIEELMGSFPPMVPVLPPTAVNDDLEAMIYEAVELELHEAGMLERRHG